jgi:hypothetical protein
MRRWRGFWILLRRLNGELMCGGHFVSFLLLRFFLTWCLCIIYVLFFCCYEMSFMMVEGGLMQGWVRYRIDAMESCSKTHDSVYSFLGVFLQRYILGRALLTRLACFSN